MLIGITGVARAGKDSVANMLVEKYGFIKLGFADAVREMAEAINPYVSTGQNRHFTEGDTPFARYTDVLRAVGYETAKGYSDVRQLLQRIGTEGGRNVVGPHVWIEAMVRKLAVLTEGMPIRQNIVICDVRFENEADMVKGFGGYMLRVVRPGFDNGMDVNHASEQSIATLPVDLEIEATGFEELLTKAVAVYYVFTNAEETRDREFETVTRAETRVYLAAPWVCKDEASAAKQRLIDAGIDVVSGWTERENTGPEIAPPDMVEQAVADRDEVDRANVLVILGLATSEGKASEMGMALAQGKRVILVKEDRTGNIFYRLPEVERVDTLDEAILLLGGEYRMNTTGGMPRTLDAGGQPLPGTPGYGMEPEDVSTAAGGPDGDSTRDDGEHGLARHSAESGKD